MGRLKYIILILLLLVNLGVSHNQLKEMTTAYNSNYEQKMIGKSLPRQETPWGFQEISLEKKIEHRVSSIDEYQKLIQSHTKGQQWNDDKVHIIHFSEGLYLIPKPKSYYVLLVPSKTIIEGAGIGKSIFKAMKEILKDDRFHFRRLFNLEYASHDVVIRGFSFYNETKDNKWGLFHANGEMDRENYLFEDIEFDDVFGAIGKANHASNFITFRGLRKRIGNTTSRIKKNFKTPVPLSYQFHTNNQQNITLAGQVGVRQGNSVIFHDCILGDNISATLDIYANYVEVVGVKFINPLHDHAIKAPNGNHLYIHDSSFELNYKTKLIEGSSYWNPTFFTHEITKNKKVSSRKNYHFKNLKFIRKYRKISAFKDNNMTNYIESEPFMIYDEDKRRNNNVSGDMVWENISFEGYSKAHQVLGYPNVQTEEGYEALSYSMLDVASAQMKADNNSSRGSYSVDVQKRSKSTKIDRSGVYSWGSSKIHVIDYPRKNRLFSGKKKEAYNKPYIKMNFSTIRMNYNQKILEY